MNLTYNVIIDLAKETDVTIQIPKGDAYSRIINFNLLNNGNRFDMSEAIGGGVKAVKPDNTVIYNDIDEITEEGIVVYTIAPQLTTAAGECSLDVEIFDEDGRTLTTFAMKIIVKNQTFDASDLVSVNDISAIKSYLARALKAAKTTEEIKAEIESAYGALEEISDEFADLKAELSDYLDYLKEQVESGAFNGAMGLPGENGSDAVIADTQGIIGFQILNGDLMCYYYDQDNVPDVSIDGDGNLIYEWS